MTEIFADYQKSHDNHVTEQIALSFSILSRCIASRHLFLLQRTSIKRVRGPRDVQKSKPSNMALITDPECVVTLFRRVS